MASAVLAAMAIMAAIEIGLTNGGRQTQSAAPAISIPVTSPTPPAGKHLPSANSGAHLGEWQLRGSSAVLAAIAGQGLATLTHPSGGTVTVYRSDQTIRAQLRQQGWTHIGDPDAWNGYVLDALQASPPAIEKAFEVTSPDGSIHDFVHRLAPGEQPNNSFVAVTTDGQWMISGEWGDMSRLLMFPTPMINPSIPAAARTIPLAATISLDRPVRNVQGCAFVSPVRMLCSTDDPGTDLWPTPDQLLQVTLPQPVNGRPLAARVTSLGELPLRSGCTGTYEVEGIDFQASTGILRVEIRSPSICGLFMTVYDFTKTN